MSLEQRLLRLTTRLLVLGAMVLLLAGAWLWFTRLPMWDLRAVRLHEAGLHVQEGALARALTGSLRGNFLTADLRVVRDRVASTPWVRQARVQRQWPGRLLLSIEEHQPFAYWGEERLLNTYGEVFEASLVDVLGATLPRLDGPPGSEQRVKEHFQFFNGVVSKQGQRVQALTLEPLENWRITLQDGLVLMLHDDKQPELQRLLERYFRLAPTLREQYNNTRIKRVDLRYPNGFAVQFDAAMVAGTASSTLAAEAASTPSAADATDAKPTGKAAAKPTAKPASKPNARPAPPASGKPAAQPGAKPSVKTGHKANITHMTPPSKHSPFAGNPHGTGI